MKKFFIRKTQADLLQEQINLLQSFISNRATVSQEEPKSYFRPSQYGILTPSPEEFKLEETEEATPFIPNIQKSSVSLAVKSSKVKIDEEDVSKLKRIRADATKLV